MSITELRQLSNLEKLKIIETLWSDLSADETAIESPDWHGAELKKTEADYRAGTISSVAWEDAKKSLRARFD
ncbi:MAG: addiction module protein [Verrucomicrobiae bacterium]|nr:addiction module protein [Verrucomicrobiae bacterium]